MKKKTAIVLFLFLAALSPLMADKLIFSEVGVSYASFITTRNLENNTTGTYDTAVFDAKAGATICKWADIYAGTGFQGFVDRINSQQNYTFYPIFGGVRANIFPDFCVYPSLMFEYGTAFSNRHTQDQTIVHKTVVGDKTWWAKYYSFGFGINWNVSDTSILSLKIERPTYSNQNVSDGELQAVKAGLTWKILY